MGNMYEQIGGEAAIDKAVELFYKKVLADERITRFFEGINMRSLYGHQKAFLTYAFSGNDSFPGQSMQDPHQRFLVEMGLSDEHFDALMEDLGSTLKELGIPDDLIAETEHIAQSTRSCVLNH
ncbi:MAG: group 1 truncated hemoglobin [bacterium]|nr:group 1 truncated hemoglobin [bacterium]